MRWHTADCFDYNLCNCHTIYVTFDKIYSKIRCTLTIQPRSRVGHIFETLRWTLRRSNSPVPGGWHRLDTRRISDSHQGVRTRGEPRSGPGCCGACLWGTWNRLLISLEKKNGYHDLNATTARHKSGFRSRKPTWSWSLLKEYRKFLTVVRFVASSPAGSGGPGARARVLIEMQSVGAHDFCAVTFDAVVEYVAHFFVRMRKVSVTPRTQIVGLRGFCRSEKNVNVILLLSLFYGNPNECAIVAIRWQYLRSSVLSPQSTLNGWSHLFTFLFNGSNTNPSGHSFSVATPSLHS